MKRTAISQLTEAQIQRQILDWLAAREKPLPYCDAEWLQRMSRYKGKTHVRYGIPGDG